MVTKLKTLFEWPAEKPNVPGDNHHWFGGSNNEILYKIIEELKPKCILELGSWTGAGSTKFILERAPDAYLVCIDHWSKDLNDYVQEEFNIEQVKELESQISILWETFLVNTWDCRHRLTPLREKTTKGLQILKKLKISFDLVYIDAHHDYENVLHDISKVHETWPDATIVGDDYLWDNVKRAVHYYAENNNLEVKSLYNCWYYAKK
jgi:predicted O-methyltransferase YrrM